ncbi:MAG: hypothetical protein ACI4TD_13820, partial [Phocaeicola sp.]
YDEEEDEFMKAVGELLDKENGCGLEETENRTGYCKAERELEAMVGLQRLKDDMKEARMMAMFNKKRAEWRWHAALWKPETTD